MKAAMQYQNKTPEEIVRQYKKRLRAKQGLLILALAESLCKYKVSANYQLVLLNTRFNCYKKMKDPERAMQVRQEAEAFVSSSTKASIQKTGQELLKVMDASLALWRGDHKTFCRMEEARSVGYTAKLQKVVSAVCLADVDIACNELKNARTHLEYALQEGGTLYVVEDARRMLAGLAQKEQMKGTGYGDGTVKI